MEFAIELEQNGIGHCNEMEKRFEMEWNSELN